jgi:hypothetical protein
MAIERDAAGMVDLDQAQVIRTQAEILPDNTGLAQKVISVGGSLVPKIYDEIALTYISSGNGTGEIGTAIYKLNSVVVATLTLQYDSSSRLVNVVKT